MTSSRKETAIWLLKNPAQLGKHLGYSDLRPQLHGVWLNDMINAKTDITIQAHRGSYKTTCLCIAIALMMVLYRDKNIMFLRKTDKDVQEVIKQVAYILQHPLFQDVIATITNGRIIQLAKHTGSEITTNAYTAPRGASQLYGTGINGALTGKHADIVITDDIINQQDRISHSERQHTKLVYQQLQNIKNRNGRIINTGTPWHIEDAFSIMPSPYKYNCYETGLLSSEDIAKLKSNMTASLFAANYQLKHIAAENALFPQQPKITDDQAMLYDGIAHVDAAYGGQDYTALTCARRDGDTIYLYGRVWQRHVDVCEGQIIAQCERLRTSPIYMENNGDKGFVGKQFRAHGQLVHIYHETQNKYYKIATYLKKWWKNIVILNGTDDEYLSQIMNYTADAQHDDAPDSAACICRLLDRGQIEL